MTKTKIATRIANATEMRVRMRKQIVCLVISTVVLLQTFAASQQSQKPMTNDDVIAMVKNKMPETVVVSAIQARPSEFNTSTTELIRLKKAGVTENELNAIIAASNKALPAEPSSKASAASAAEAASAVPVSKSHMPKLY